MSSEDAKRVKNEVDDDDDDDKSLSSILLNKNKKPNPNTPSTTKSLSLKDAKSKKLGSKLKKEEQDSDEEFTPYKNTLNNDKPKKEGVDTVDFCMILILMQKKTPISKVKKEEAGNANTKKTPNSEVKKEKIGNSDKKKGGKIIEQNGKMKEEKRKGGKGEPSAVKGKKERKVYELPGQKRDPPEERDPLRIFYESLYEQIPTSEMAAIWMMESGLLPRDVAKKLFEAKRKKAQEQKLGSPMKTVVTVKRKSDSSVSIKKKTVSTEKKKTPPSKAPSVQSKKRKIADDIDGSSEDESDDDFVIGRKIKKQKAA
ncbi:hypothetical protein L6452_13844 [Arctium lappa]|uniref:Uncharacterized protein n=1 Tax=Arctium lappa TaxID=4217 RepID=A0ACB9CJC0_ARCLA|nr:hypothetical protein L6452_13844 [Arctium lappa]